jgi:hypothetical protein
MDKRTRANDNGDIRNGCPCLDVLKKLSLSSELIMPSLRRLFYLWNMADDNKTFLGPVELKLNNLN